MPAEPPEPGGDVRLGQLRRPLQELLQELLVGTVELRLLRRVVHIEDLEKEAECDGDQNQHVHLYPLLHRLAGKSDFGEYEAAM